MNDSQQQQTTFYERTSIEQFAMDGQCISELISITRQQISHHRRSGPTPDTLHVFNEAYRLAFLATTDVGSVETFLDSYDADRKSASTCQFVTAVAWCLLRMHQELLCIDVSVIRIVREHIGQGHVFTAYESFLNKHACTLTEAIRFDGIHLVPKSKESHRPMTLAEQVDEAQQNLAMFISRLVEENRQLRAENSNLRNQLQEQKATPTIPLPASPQQIKFEIQHVDTLAPAASQVSPQYHQASNQ